MKKKQKEGKKQPVRPVAPYVGSFEEFLERFGARGGILITFFETGLGCNVSGCTPAEMSFAAAYLNAEALKRAGKELVKK